MLFFEPRGFNNQFNNNVKIQFNKNIKILIITKQRILFPKAAKPQNTMEAIGFMKNREKDPLFDSEPAVVWVCFIKLPFLTSLTLETQCGPRHRKSGEQMFYITFHLYLKYIFS